MQVRGHQVAVMYHQEWAVASPLPDSVHTSFKSPNSVAEKLGAGFVT